MISRLLPRDCELVGFEQDDPGSEDWRGVGKIGDRPFRFRVFLDASIVVSANFLQERVLRQFREMKAEAIRRGWLPRSSADGEDEVVDILASREESR